MALNRVILLKA